MVVCNKDEIVKSGYKTKKGVYVKETCIKDLGNPGKGPKLLPKLKSGTLTSHGYSSSDKKDDRQKQDEKNQPGSEIRLLQDE